MIAIIQNYSTITLSPVNILTMDSYCCVCDSTMS